MEKLLPRSVEVSCQVSPALPLPSPEPPTCSRRVLDFECQTGPGSVRSPAALAFPATSWCGPHVRPPCGMVIPCQRSSKYKQHVSRARIEKAVAHVCRGARKNGAHSTQRCRRVHGWRRRGRWRWSRFAGCGGRVSSGQFRAVLGAEAGAGAVPMLVRGVEPVPCVAPPGVTCPRARWVSMFL